MSVPAHPRRGFRRRAFFALVLGGLLAWNILAARRPAAVSSAPGGPPPERIASLAPSLTETLFALGAERRIVGVTERCRFPEAARDLPKIGDYLQPNYEALARARPDMVLALEEHAPAFSRLDELGLRYMVFDHRSLAGLLDSFDRLGGLVARPEEGRALRARLEGLIADLAQRRAASDSPAVSGDAGGSGNFDGPGAPSYRPGRLPSMPASAGARPRTLLVIARDYAAERPVDVWAAGPGNLYDELLRAAGGENVCGGGVSFPLLGVEGVARLRPEVVVELAGMEAEAAAAGDSRAVWAKTPGFSARVEVIRGEAAFIPGPRTADFLEELARAVQGGIGKSLWPSSSASPCPSSPLAPRP